MSETSTPSATATVSRIANVIIPVRDQDAMLAFYTEKLGLGLRDDVPFGNGERWIEVTASPDAETVIALSPPGPSNEAGNRETGITLQTDDINAYHALLAGRGVDVDAEVSLMGDPVPPLFWLRDPEGNQLMVVEVR
jgi:catechol 2,3-dioxygenase-like lactoylglutathione lyase family enzyme